MAWALISGASSGIGEATAALLAKNGYDLVLVARREDRLLQLEKKLKRETGRLVEVHVLDVRQNSQIKSMAEKFAGLDLEVLINNAGLAKGVDPVFKGDPGDWEQMIDTNIKGLLYLTRAFLPGMIERGHGHIVNVGSVAGRWAYPGGAVYCGTKFAVRAISEGLRMDLLGTPIRVTNIEPGMVETEFSQVRLGDVNKAKAVYQGMKPLTAEDVADAILWSLTRPAHVNIQEIVLFPTDQAGVQNVHRR